MTLGEFRNATMGLPDTVELLTNAWAEDKLADVVQVRLIRPQDVDEEDGPTVLELDDIGVIDAYAGTGEVGTLLYPAAG